MGWSQAAKSRASQIEREFKDDLRHIADCLASHDRAAAVAVVHVDRAFDALATVGLSRKRWIDRPDAETALEGALIGASFAAPDVVSALIDEASHKGVAAGTLVALFGSHCSSRVCLFRRGRPSTESLKEQIQTCQPTNQCSNSFTATT